jgi:hypothetical protein
MSHSTDQGDPCLQELLHHYEQLRQFKSELPEPVQAWLNLCEWTLMPQAGQNGMVLIVIRAPERITLRNPRLHCLAEIAQRYWGASDFSLFSGESPEPVRVLSQTLLDLGHRL